MTRELYDAVRSRAGGLCEYCRMPQEYDRAPFQVDHIIANFHGGATTASNLCLACFHCNSFKGPNLAGIDPRNKRRIVPLFHPRRHKWSWHFRWDGPRLVGRTSTGRATVPTLRINLPNRVVQRQLLIDEEVFPPD